MSLQIVLLGPDGSELSYPIASPAVCVSETDHVRVIEGKRHWMIQRVPQSVVDVFGIGSVAPAALLYDARLLFDVDDPEVMLICPTPPDWSSDRDAVIHGSCSRLVRNPCPS